MSRGWLKKFQLSLKEFHEVPNAVHSGQVQVGFGMLLSPHIITWVPNICQIEHSLAFCYPWKSLFSWPPLTSQSLQPRAVVRTDHQGDVRRTFNATNQDIFLVCNLRTWKSRTHNIKKSNVCCDVEDITESRRKRWEGDGKEMDRNSKYLSERNLKTRFWGSPRKTWDIIHLMFTWHWC